MRLRRRKRLAPRAPVGGGQRVLVVTNYFAPHVGGIEEVVAQQARSLVGRGYEVTVVTCRASPALPRQESVEGRFDVVRIRAFNYLDRRFGLPFAVVSPFSLWRLYRLARAHDSVHVHDLFYPISHVGALAAALARRPMLVTQHVALVEHPSGMVMAIQAAIYSTIGRVVLKRASAAIAYHQHVEDHLLALGLASERVLRMSNGIDVKYFAPVSTYERAELRSLLGFDPDLPIVLFVGRLVPKKGFDLLARSSPTSACVKVIVGGGEVPAALRRAPGTVFLGPRSQAQLRDLYRASDVFVFPAASEVFTLVMQEAMACGLPVVTTEDPAYDAAGLSGDGVRFVERTVTAVSDAIDDLLSSPDVLAQMRTYSRRYAEDHFSWEANFVDEARAHERLLAR